MIRAAVGFSFLTLLVGCVEQPKGPDPWWGVTDPISKVAVDVNHNTNQVPTLWASGGYDAHIIDHGRTTDVSGDAILMYAKPKNVLFVGKAGPLGQVFRMGSGPDQYWLTVKDPGPDTTWYGTLARIDQIDTTQLPIRPDLIEGVLGLDPFDENMLRPPCPIMRFNNDQRAYMVVWGTHLSDRWVAVKEVWYDLDTKLPRLVNLFDVNGRVVLSAYLSDYQTVKDSAASPTTQPAAGPKVATQYRLFFPDTGSKLTLHLTDLRFQSKGHPNAHNFEFDPESNDTAHLIDLDATAK